MSTILDRVEGVLDRARNLGPLAARVRARHEASHREMIARGLDPDGRPVAPLAPSTLRRRRGDGPPRAPRGVASRVVAGCEITATASGDALTLRKRWPGFAAARWLNDGTRRMPARPMGFRPADRDRDREDFRRHVLRDEGQNS